jgi:hypothetical protein
MHDPITPNTLGRAKRDERAFPMVDPDPIAVATLASTISATCAWALKGLLDRRWWIQEVKTAWREGADYGRRMDFRAEVTAAKRTAAQMAATRQPHPRRYEHGLPDGRHRKDTLIIPRARGVAKI